MKLFSCSSIIASVIASAGLMLGSSAVLAQSVDVDFAGNIPNTCSFGAPAGTGVLAKANGGVEAGIGVAGLSYGTATSVTVDCIGGGSISVSAPIGSGPAGFSPASFQSVVELGSNGLTTTTFTGSEYWDFFSPNALAVPSGEQTLNVGMVAGTLGSLEVIPGDYNYTVTLTATPD